MTDLQIATLHERVIERITAEFTTVTLVTGENDAADEQELPLPAIVVAITDVEGRPDADSDGTGRLPVQVYFAATIVLSDRGQGVALDLRDSSMALASLVYGNRWGLGGHVGPARFLQAGPDEFSPRIAGRRAWRVEWVQPAWIGRTAWPVLPGPVPQPLASWAPDIGTDHENEYRSLPDIGAAP